MKRPVFKISKPPTASTQFKWNSHFPVDSAYCVNAFWWASPSNIVMRRNALIGQIKQLIRGN